MVFLFYVGDRDFRELLEDVRETKRHAYASGTFSNLKTQFRCYFAFCYYFQRTPLPANSDTICAFVQFLSRTMKPDTVRNYLSGVRTLHSLMDFSYEFSEDFHLKLVLRGMSRISPHVPDRARPITPSILKLFHQHMDHSNSLHSATWACSLVLFFSMSRLGSILPRSSSKKETRVFLTRDRIRFCQEGLLVTLLHTKTIQFGERFLHIPLIKLRSELCPVFAYRQMLAKVRYFSFIPAFVYIKDNKVHWLTRDLFIKTFRSVARSFISGDITSFRGHSFRRGGASWAFATGVPGELIQVCGDWASDAYKRYIEFDISRKLELASLFCKDL